MPSRSIASTFTGVPCLEEVRYGFVHGTSPAVAEVKVSGQLTMQVGQEHAIRIDQSLFVGYVTNITYDQEVQTTSVRMVDWRDRMRDVTIFAAWNMQEDGGIWFHIEEENWDRQIKTYVSARSLDAASLKQIQAFPDAELNDEVSFHYDKFKTAWWIVARLCRAYNIQLVCDANVKKILQTCIPDNVDANSGLSLADVIDFVLSKANCQFSCYGRNLMVVTQRGVALAGMGNLIRQSFANPCSTGAKNAQIGEELNEQGRRVRLVGDPNQYENIYPCLPDWNKNWDFDFTFSGANFSALLSAAKLTGQDTVSKLPAKYWDESYWPGDSFEERAVGAVATRRTRNDMTIDEYRSKVAWKCYRVDPDFVMHGVEGPCDPQVAREKIRVIPFDKSQLSHNREDFEEGENGADLPLEQQGFGIDDYFAAMPVVPPEAGKQGPDPKVMQFDYPLAASLLTNSMKQYTCYASSQDIPEGWVFPFSRQLMMVPQDSGCSLQVEECAVDKVDFRKRWIIRVLFTQPQIYNDLQLNFFHKAFVKTDKMCVRLNIQREIYQYTKGESGVGLRVREKKVAVRNLFKGFLEGVEMPVLRELVQQDGQVRDKIAKADDVAKGIATKLLSNEPITLSGGLTFEDRAGFIPDGLIDSVAVSFDQMNGITEQINFTTASNTDESFIGPSRIKVQGSELMQNEIISQRLQAIGKAALQQKDAINRVRAIAEHGLRQWGGFVGKVVADKAFGRDGIVQVDIKEQHVTKTIQPRSIMPMAD